jgi:metallo-beta-lactamase class B
MGRLIEATGAPLLASADSAEVMTSGLLDARDPQRDIHDPMMPVDVSGIVAPDVPLKVGTQSVKSVATPGHTPGAISWTWESCDEDGECLGIVYGDSLSATSADDYRFSDHPDYVSSFREGLSALASIERCDIFLNPHPSFGDLRNKILAGDLIGGLDCLEHARRMTARLEARLAQEAEAAQ